MSLYYLPLPELCSQWRQIRGRSCGQGRGCGCQRGESNRDMALTPECRLTHSHSHSQKQLLWQSGDPPVSRLCTWAALFSSSMDPPDSASARTYLYLPTRAAHNHHATSALPSPRESVEKISQLSPYTLLLQRPLPARHPLPSQKFYGCVEHHTQPPSTRSLETARHAPASPGSAATLVAESIIPLKTHRVFPHTLATPPPTYEQDCARRLPGVTHTPRRGDYEIAACSLYRRRMHITTPWTGWTA
jgi:hypothetical protein